MCLRCESWQKRPVSRRTPSGGLRMPTAKRIRPRSASSPGLSACSQRNSSRREAAMGKAKSRANGDGDVFPRKNKAGKVTSYRGAYFGPDGKRRYVSGKTKEEARQKLRKARADTDHGLIFDGENLKVGEYLDRWLSDSVRDTVRQRTFERYESIVRVHIKPAFGRMKLKALTPHHARGLYREKLDSGLAPRTVNYIHTTLHKALKDAVSDGLVPRNVTEGVKAPRANKREVNALSLDQARAFL